MPTTRPTGSNCPHGGRRTPTARRAQCRSSRTRSQLVDELLPAVPDRYRALVAVAGGTGLRWGECAGLRWDCIDLDAKTVSVVRVAIEVAGSVSIKPYPKVPIPDHEAELLKIHREPFKPGPAGDVFTNQAGGPMRRTLFRSRVWRPSLVRAGLLGQVDKLGHFSYRGSWCDADGMEWSLDFATEQEAVGHVAKVAHGGLRFHGLRHSYATWLVSQGVPINDVVTVMGHEKATTTLNLYTHRSPDRDSRIRRAFADEMLTADPETDPEDDDDPFEEGS